MIEVSVSFSNMSACGIVSVLTGDLIIPIVGSLPFYEFWITVEEIEEANVTRRKP